MTTRKVMILGLAVMCALSLTGEAMARGGSGGGSGRGGGGQGVHTSTSAPSTATRPADSQRRDGTFLTTGTTANGSTTRPANGKGVQDGSRLSTPTVPASSTVTE